MSQARVLLSWSYFSSSKRNFITSVCSFRLQGWAEHYAAKVLLRHDELLDIEICGFALTLLHEMGIQILTTQSQLMGKLIDLQNTVSHQWRHSRTAAVARTSRNFKSGIQDGSTDGAQTWDKNWLTETSLLKMRWDGRTQTSCFSTNGDKKERRNGATQIF